MSAAVTEERVLHSPRNAGSASWGSALELPWTLARVLLSVTTKSSLGTLLRSSRFSSAIFSACSIQECPSQPILLTRAAPAPPAPKFFFPIRIFVTGRVKAVFQEEEGQIACSSSRGLGSFPISKINFSHTWPKAKPPFLLQCILKVFSASVRGLQFGRASVNSLLGNVTVCFPVPQDSG